MKMNEFFAVALMAAAVAAGCKTTADSGVSLGVISGDAAGEQKAFEPVVELLSEKLGQEVSLVVYAHKKAVADAMLAGKVDVLFLSPEDYVAIKDDAKIKAVATKLNKGGTPFCQGTIVVPKESSIKKVSDLKGKSFHYGPKGTFNKYHAALAEMKKHGVKPSDLKSESFGGGCGGIADTVLEGKADAGVVCDYSWYGWQESKDAKSQKLRVIGQGPKLRDMAVAVAEGATAAPTKVLVEALVGLGSNPVMLNPPLKAKGFAAATDADYDSLRAVLKDLKVN